MEQTTILDELESEDFVVIPIRGVSMRPLLLQESSHVYIRKLDGRPKRNDVVLYVRPDGKQVLHRIIAIDGDTCLIRGDNTYGLEPVPLSSVKGVMESCWRRKDAGRGGREIKATDFPYRMYVWFWNLVYPLRLFLHKSKRWIRKTGRRLLRGTFPIFKL